MSIPFLLQLFKFNEKATGHDQLQSFDHTIEGRVKKKWNNNFFLTFRTM